MKKSVFVFVLFSIMTVTALNAQNRYFTKEGKAHFISEAPLEKIEAVNRKVASVLDISTGQIEFSVLMKAFEFEKALMQEHFNENYVESDKFPKAVFKGKIEDASNIKWTVDGKYPVKVSGKMTIHGVTKDITVPGNIEVKSGNIRGTSSFTVLIRISTLPLSMVNPL